MLMQKNKKVISDLWYCFPGWPQRLWQREGLLPLLPRTTCGNMHLYASCFYRALQSSVKDHPCSKISAENSVTAAVLGNTLCDTPVPDLKFSIDRQTTSCYDLCSISFTVIIDSVFTFHISPFRTPVFSLSTSHHLEPQCFHFQHLTI